MEAFGVLVAIVIAVLVSTIGRMRGAPRVPVFFWIMLVAVTIVPMITGWMVLQKGEVAQQVSFAAEKEHQSLRIPEGHALLITGVLSEEQGKTEEAYKTAYTLRIQGTTSTGNIWKQKVSGEVTKQNNSNKQLQELGQGIREAGGKPKNKTGQHVQDRFRVEGYGDVDLFVENYSGQAAQRLEVEVIPAPPPAMWLWGFAVFASIIGVYLESWKNCDKVSGDLAGLAFYAVFVADGLTPSASWFNVASAFLPGMFLGWGVVAGIAWLALKYNTSNTPTT